MVGPGPLMIGATAITGVAKLSAGGTSADAARILAGGVIATATLLALDSVRPEWATGLAAIAFVTACLVHGVALTEALLGSIDNVSTVIPTVPQ